MENFNDVKYERVGNTDVYLGINMTKFLPTVIPDEVKNGHIALAYFKSDHDIAKDVLFELKQAKILIYEFEIDEELSFEEMAKSIRKIPEYVRGIIGVGNEKISSLCSYYSSINAIDFFLFPLAPSSDRLITPTSLLKKACTAKILVADEEILENAPKNLIAAGWGIALSEPLRIFEKCVATKIEGKNIVNCHESESIIDIYNRLLKNTISITPDTSELFWFLVNLSEQKRQENFVSGLDTFCEIIELSDGTRERGEYMLIAAFVLKEYYMRFLSSNASDVLLPPDKMKSMKLLEKKCGLPFNLLLKKIDFLSVNRYFRIKYILDEYRPDLLECISCVNLNERKWRRLYDDAGFWLKECFSTKELMSIMALSGEMSGGLLGFAKDSGALEDYI